MFSLRPTVLAVALGLVVPAGLVLADSDDPVSARETSMKTVGQSTKTLGDMVKGETAFDAAAALAALEAMHENLVGWEDHYADEATRGQSTNEYFASDAVWTDREGFVEQVNAFRADIDAAIAADPQTQQELAPVFGAVAQNCRACHEDYRVKQ